MGYVIQSLFLDIFKDVSTSYFDNIFHKTHQDTKIQPGKSFTNLNQCKFEAHDEKTRLTPGNTYLLAKRSKGWHLVSKTTSAQTNICIVDTKQAKFFSDVLFR